MSRVSTVGTPHSLCVYKSVCVCVHVCDSQLQKVSRDTCHTYNTHMHTHIYASGAIAHTYVHVAWPTPAQPRQPDMGSPHG